MRVRGILRWACIGAAAAGLCAAAVPVAMRLSMAPYARHSLEDIPQSEVAIVLGASVYRGRPSPVLEKRAEEALALYRARIVSAILVTGDNGALSHDEVTPVRKYLLDAGVLPEDIFLDHAGFDTYSSMYRAREVFLARTAIVVTQDFHMPRALFLARTLGIDARGIVAEGGGSARDVLREIPASIKAIFDVALGRTPKYLGETFPLSGDGTKTWY